MTTKSTQPNPPPKTMTEWRIENAKRAMAALTPQQRQDFPDLPFSDKLYVLTNHKWPDGVVMAPKSNSAHQIAGAAKRGKNKKEDITFDQIVKAAQAWGQKEFTSHAIYHVLEPRRGDQAIRHALSLYAEAGKLIVRECGNRTRYSLAVQS